jgi:hypothetical protein
MITLTADIFACFSLTLREREQFSINSRSSSAARLADRLATILPLPGAEGWGEGECETI